MAVEVIVDVPALKVKLVAFDSKLNRSSPDSVTLEAFKVSVLVPAPKFIAAAVMV